MNEKENPTATKPEQQSRIISDYMTFLRSFTKRMLEDKCQSETTKYLAEQNLRVAEQYLEGK